MLVPGLKLSGFKRLWIFVALVASLVVPMFLLSPSHRAGPSNFERVQRGQSREHVWALLGPPMAMETATLPESPFWGPQEALDSIIEPGSPYEEWRWEGKGRVYYVWFAGRDSDRIDDWVVVCTGDYPLGAVF